MKIFYLRLSLIYLFILSHSSFAQSETYQKGIEKSLVFENIFTNNGLPDNRIRSVYESKKGFLWIGTMNGLASYDGYTFIQYYKDREGKGLAGNWVYDIKEDVDENMWIGTTEGLSKIITSKDEVVNYVTAKHLPHKEIRALFIDNYQRVWIGTKKGLSIFNTKTDEVTKFTEGPFNNAINAIERDLQGRIWLTCETGLISFNEKDITHNYIPIEVKSNPYGDKIWDIHPFEKEIWIATGGDGIHSLNIEFLNKTKKDLINIQVTKKSFVEDLEVFDLAEDGKGNIWLATSNGLGRIEFFKPAEKISFYYNQSINEYSISNNKLYKLYFDSSKNLWIGSDIGLNTLLYKNLNFENFAFANSTFKDIIRGITSIDKEKLIFNTSSNGIYKIHENSLATEKIKIKNNSEKINLGRSITNIDHTLFIGTLDGVLIKNTKNGKESHILHGKNIFSIVEDIINLKVYIGASDGMYVYDHKTSQLSSKTPILKGFTRSIFISKDLTVWVGIDGPYIYTKKNNSQNFKKITIPSNFHGFEINGIAEDQDNNIWIGTTSGLSKLTPNLKGNYNCDFFDENNGLVDKSVNGLIIDVKNNIWLSTIKGITKYDTKNKLFEYHLPNLIFNPTSYYKQNNNSFIFGHLEGFVKFNPDEISINNNTPNIQITSLRISNEKVNVYEEINNDVVLKENIQFTDEITLNHENNIITLEFADLNGSFDENRQYAYKLEGFDKNWIYNKRNEHTATYTNLDSGNYIFKVRSVYKGSDDNNTKVLKIKVLAPPWKSWWAILGYILILNGIIFLLVKFRIENAKKVNQIILEKQEKEQIKLLNNQKLQFFTNISHEFRTPVTLITGPIKDIINDPSISVEVRKKAKIIEKNSDKMFYLIDELITFRELGKGFLKLKPKPLNIVQFANETLENFELFAKKKEVILKCNSPSEQLIIWADPLQLYKVLNNLVANALKFCPFNTIVKITIQDVKKTKLSLEQKTIDSNWISITVSDEGTGIPKENIKHLFERFYKGDDVHAGTGIGLSLSKEIVELHKGSIKVKSKPGNTRFIVWLPKGNADEVELNQVVESSASLNQKLKPESLLIDENIALDQAYENTFEDFDKKRILLVEDNIELLEYLSMLLKEDFNIITALNGIEALEKLENTIPDAIVSDVMMPKMDGFKLCEKIKENKKIMHIPIILLTAKTMPEEKIKGLELGADDYLDKPFNPEILKARIHMLIKNRATLIEKLNVGQIIDHTKLARNPLDEKLITQVVEHINNNIDNEEFSVERLSDLMSMSRSNLFRRIKMITEMSPVEFIYHIRLQKSMKLLKERQLSISEIAWEVGFKNPSSFSKSFKKQFGKSPSDYLNSLLND